MQTSGIPARVAVPFADSGTKNIIPVPSQVAVSPGLASYTTGFPPLTMTPITAGGVPPYGADFNGILNAITNAIRWNSAGSGYPFDSTFASAVTGYPKGALVPASDYSGYWINTTEANSISPENTTGATTGWVPGVHYGTTSITGLAAASVTLSTLQAAKPRITLAGALTANINLVFPAWIRSWTVVNNCTGAFTVTCKTPSGTGVAIPIGLTALINGDGTNITQDTNIFGVPGRLLRVSIYTNVAGVQYVAINGGTPTSTSATLFTALPATNAVEIECQGAGSGGGGVSANGTNPSVAGGGGAGSYGMGRYTAGFSSITVTVGVGGAGGTAGNNFGLVGGTSSAGSLITSVGGYTGAGGSPTVAPFINGGTNFSDDATGANLLLVAGSAGGYGIAIGGLNAASGGGGSSRFGTGSPPASNRAGFNSKNYGSGGSGAASYSSGSTALAGGSGGSGIVIIREYS